MSAQKYHIGKNGPARCNAQKIACRLGGADGTERHGSLADVTALWEQEQEALHSPTLLAGVSRSFEDIEEAHEAEELADGHNFHRLSTEDRLSNPSGYAPASSKVSYTEEERSVAMALALSELGPLSYAPIQREDSEWSSEGCTSVRRYELTDGSVGYFKSFAENSDSSEKLFREYGTTSLEAAVNEVNSHRMANLLGPGFDELVPETALREADGRLGTIQREVPENSALDRNFARNELLQKDYRKAAIFDFVTGNLDRHEDNYLYGAERDSDGELANRVRLIDNSFSFPADLDRAQLNVSLFANNEGADNYLTDDYRYIVGYQIPRDEYELRPEEKVALKRAQRGVQSWIEAGTVGKAQGEGTLHRIDYLLSAGRLTGFTSYLLANSSHDPDDYDLSLFDDLSASPAMD